MVDILTNIKDGRYFNQYKGNLQIKKHLVNCVNG